MKRTKIVRLLESAIPVEKVMIKGWVRTVRKSKTFSFIEINDGSCLSNLQVIVNDSISNYQEVGKLTTGSSVEFTGKLIESEGKGQTWEVQAEKAVIISIAPSSYPLQKKRHSDEYLRTIAHLRPRTNKYGAAFRIRSELSFAIHTFFKNKGFTYIHTPIITGSDCEGAGEMFRVSRSHLLDETSKDKKTESMADFFGKEANLTVSGQLSAEMFALALGDVYTFGPTFRAENSNTSRHAAEFWMVEPEMTFCDLAGNMDLSEELLKFLVGRIMETCKEDINLFAKFVDKQLIAKLENICLSDFERILYKDALEILTSSGRKFDFEVKFGNDLQSEHERFITEEYFKKPVIIYNYPKHIKPFYMRVNDDGITVAAMDVLVPAIGEIIGGSQREERTEQLVARMDELGLDKQAYWWYIESRKYGTVPHSGFGLGFERLIMLVTGIKNIRDVIPFPRTPGNLEI